MDFLQFLREFPKIVFLHILLSLPGMIGVWALLIVNGLKIWQALILAAEITVLTSAVFVITTVFCGPLSKRILED